MSTVKSGTLVNSGYGGAYGVGYFTGYTIIGAVTGLAAGNYTFGLDNVNGWGVTVGSSLVIIEQ